MASTNQSSPEQAFEINTDIFARSLTLRDASGTRQFFQSEGQGGILTAHFGTKEVILTGDVPQPNETFVFGVYGVLSDGTEIYTMAIKGNVPRLVTISDAGICTTVMQEAFLPWQDTSQDFWQVRWHSGYFIATHPDSEAIRINVEYWLNNPRRPQELADITVAKFGPAYPPVITYPQDYAENTTSKLPKIPRYGVYFAWQYEYKTGEVSSRGAQSDPTFLAFAGFTCEADLDPRDKARIFNVGAMTRRDVVAVRLLYKQGIAGVWRIVYRVEISDTTTVLPSLARPIEYDALFGASPIDDTQDPSGNVPIQPAALEMAKNCMVAANYVADYALPSVTGTVENLSLNPSELDGFAINFYETSTYFNASGQPNGFTRKVHRPGATYKCAVILSDEFGRRTTALADTTFVPEEYGRIANPYDLNSAPYITKGGFVDYKIDVANGLSPNPEEFTGYAPNPTFITQATFPKFRGTFVFDSMPSWARQVRLVQTRALGRNRFIQTPATLLFRYRTSDGTEFMSAAFQAAPGNNNTFIGLTFVIPIEAGYQPSIGQRVYLRAASQGTFSNVDPLRASLPKAIAQSVLPIYYDVTSVSGTQVTCLLTADEALLFVGAGIPQRIGNHNNYPWIRVLIEIEDAVTNTTVSNVDASNIYYETGDVIDVVAGQLSYSFELKGDYYAYGNPLAWRGEGDTTNAYKNKGTISASSQVVQLDSDPGDSGNGSNAHTISGYDCFGLLLSESPLSNTPTTHDFLAGFVSTAFDKQITAARATQRFIASAPYIYGTQTNNINYFDVSTISEVPLEHEGITCAYVAETGSELQSRLIIVSRRGVCSVYLGPISVKNGQDGVEVNGSSFFSQINPLAGRGGCQLPHLSCTDKEGHVWFFDNIVKELWQADTSGLTPLGLSRGCRNYLNAKFPDGADGVMVFSPHFREVWLFSTRGALLLSRRDEPRFCSFTVPDYGNGGVSFKGVAAFNAPFTGFMAQGNRLFKIDQTGDETLLGQPYIKSCEYEGRAPFLDTKMAMPIKASAVGWDFTAATLLDTPLGDVAANISTDTQTGKSSVTLRTLDGKDARDYYGLRVRLESKKAGSRLFSIILHQVVNQS